MKKLKLNHDGDSITAAFIEDDKVIRLREKLETIMNDNSLDTISEKIALAIELYADTVEEAIGIGISIFGSMLDHNKGGKAYPADEFFGRRVEIERRDIQNSIKRIVDELDIPSKINNMPDDAIANYLKNVNCTACNKDGDCPIQDVAARRGLL